MVKAIKMIANFITENWLILFFLLTLFAIICLIIITIKSCRTVAASMDIPNLRAAAENEYFLTKERKEDHHNGSESKEPIGSNESDYSDLF
jgi:hypothetical protein